MENIIEGIAPETFKGECPEHGQFVGRVFRLKAGQVIRSQCPACVEADTARRAAEDARLAARERAENRQREVEGKVAVSGIPLRFQDRSFDNYEAATPEQRRVLAVCKRFADTWPIRLQEGSILVLAGKTGTGKTHLACAIANHVMQHHLAPTVFGTLADILRGVRQSYSKDSEVSERDAIRALTTPDLLVVDEIGGSRGSDYESQIMFDVINARYADKRPMILLSNLAPEELENHLGDRMSDRIREVGHFVPFTWTTYRRR